MTIVTANVLVENEQLTILGLRVSEILMSFQDPFSQKAIKMASDEYKVAPEEIRAFLNSTYGKDAVSKLQKETIEHTANHFFAESIYPTKWLCEKIITRWQEMKEDFIKEEEEHEEEDRQFFKEVERRMYCAIKMKNIKAENAFKAVLEFKGKI